MDSQSIMILTNDNNTSSMLNDDDSDSPPPERPTSLLFDSNNVSHDSNDENCVNGSLDREESHRSRASSVGQNGKFHLRDISPARLRQRHKSHSRKLDKDEKVTPSPKKNVRTTTTSWLPVSFQQMFPSYKSKAGDFKRLFKDVPETERLITDYSCALQRDILVHGRLYVSQSWLCFYANIFGWETLVTIPLNHVTSMTKEKTALVIPNAIQVWTETEKYFFTSFVSRDSTFRSVYRIWQNVLLDEPEQAPALMKAVGKYVDVDSEEFDNSSRGSNDDLPSDFDEIIVDDDLDDESLVESEEPHSNDSSKETSNKLNEDTHKAKEEISNDDIPGIAVSPASPLDIEKSESESAGPVKTLNETVAPRKKVATSTPESRRRFPFPFKKELSPLVRRKKQQQAKKRATRDKIANALHRDSLIEEGSLSEDSDSTGPISCPCDSHFSSQYINEEYATDVDTMYEYLFTDCDFYRSMRAARTDFDLDIDPWVDGGDKKRRCVRYGINLNLTIGPKTAKIQEKQELEASEPGQYYVVQSNVVNEGIPYSDSFVVVQRYCLTRVDSYMCRLRVTATVTYTRPIWGFVKGIISRNSDEGLSSFFNFLKAFIRAAEEQSTFGTRRRLKKPTDQPENLEAALAKMAEKGDGTGDSIIAPPVTVLGRLSRVWRESCFSSIFILLLVMLLVLNVYLSYRVISLERSTLSFEPYRLPSLPSEWPTDLEEFRNILYKQQYIHNIQLKRWQQVLSTSMQFLQQVQDSLKQLQDEVEKPWNE